MVASVFLKPLDWTSQCFIARDVLVLDNDADENDVRGVICEQRNVEFWLCDDVDQRQ